ncbi:MAG: hypothetical protein VKL39_23430 [Leptolyngbyaceae bacterium]|nr:hypothetical protein [Leptolyngbyaceae bacterium]
MSASVFASDLNSSKFIIYNNNNGNFYCTSGNKIMQIDSNGLISLFFSPDEPPYVYLGDPNGLAFDSNWNLYVADIQNRIIKIDQNGVPSEYLSGGLINTPSGLAFDTEGNLYCCNFGNNTIIKIDQNKNVVTLASNVIQPNKLVFYNDKLYCSNLGPKTISEITLNGEVSYFYNPENNNLLNIPIGIIFDSAGNLYCANYGNNNIIKILTNSSASIYSESNLINGPYDVALNNNLYVINSLNSNVLEIEVQPITVQSEFNKVLNDPPFLLNATSTISSPIIYVSSNTNVATVNESGLVTITGPGSCTITLTQYSGDIIDASATSIINVSRNTITVQSEFNKLLGDPPFPLDATSTSSSPIIYNSSNESVATVNESGIVTITGPGSSTITLTQYFGDIVDTSANSIINVSNNTITVQSEFNKIVNDSSFPLNATSTSSSPIIYVSSNTNVATVNESGLVTITGPGSCTITLTQYFGDIVDTSANTIINIYNNEPFGNVSAMAYDINNHLLYVYSNNQYPNNFITIDNDGNTTSLNIPTPNTNILSISILDDQILDRPIYVGGIFNSLSGNQNNVNISELKNVNIPYSSIRLSVNNTFVDNIENDQTIGVITTNTGLPFEISKNGP